MPVLLFIFGELFKLCIVGPVCMVLLPVEVAKSLLESIRIKRKVKMTEEEITENKRLVMVKKTNKKGFYTNHTPVMIIGRENLGYGKIIKMDYDPEYYAPYAVNAGELVLHIKYDGDNTHYFVNLNQLKT